MNRHKRVGREVYISSSSPEDFLSILAEAFGVDGVIGTRAEVADGVYTGHLEGELCNRDEKARRVKELAEERGIDLLRSFAYSDSINDLPLLELVGNPVAMNPDIPLVRIARRNGWQVIDLDRLARLGHPAERPRGVRRVEIDGGGAGPGVPPQPGLPGEDRPAVPHSRDRPV